MTALEPHLQRARVLLSSDIVSVIGEVFHWQGRDNYLFSDELEFVVSAAGSVFAVTDSSILRAVIDFLVWLPVIEVLAFHHFLFYFFIHGSIISV